MAQIRRNNANMEGAAKRPHRNDTAAKQASQFPGVGMTLRSYNYEEGSPRRPRGSKGIVKQSRFKRIFGGWSYKKAAIVAVIVLLVGFGWVGGKLLYNLHKLFGGNIFGVLSSTKLKGEDAGRVNILLAGNSADDIGHNGGQLTDSIMLVSIDTKNNKGFMLSIPRDLYVSIPHNGHGKINEAYVDGETDKFDENNYPTGGMGALEKIVEDDFGIDVNYYALVNYSAVRDTVDAVGGVDLTVNSPDPRGLYDPSIDYITHKPLVRLSNGMHHLNGQQALNLSRARGDAYGSYGFPAADFDRTAHQRQLLLALKTKATSAGVLANPAKVSSLSDAIGKNVKTDMSLSEFKRLHELTKNINGNNIQSLSLNSANGKNLLVSYSTKSGQSALIPAEGLDEFGQIQRFLHQQMSSNPLVQEGANVVVLNGTTSSGLAKKEKTTMSAKGISVSKVGDASGSFPQTQIVDLSHGKKPATKQLLGQIYGTNFVTTSPYANIYNADFIVIIGDNRIPQTPATSTTTAE